MADLRTSLVLDKLLQIVRLYTAGVLQPPGNPATPPPHRSFSHPAPTLPSTPLLGIIASAHARIHTRVCIHTHTHTRMTRSRIAYSRGILAKNCKRFVHSSLARARAFICHQKMLIALFRFRLIERARVPFPSLYLSFPPG